VFVPVGLNYDRTLEDRTLLLDAAGAGAPRPGLVRAAATATRFVLGQLALAVRGRWHRFGYACVIFGTPISMRAYLRHRRIDFRSLPPEEQSARLAALGDDLMAAVGAAVPVTPVPLVATLFAEQAEDGGGPLSPLELKAAAWRRIAALEAAGATVYVPRRDQDYAIEAGLRVLTLRRLVEEHDGLYQASPGELPLLRYYANSIAHFGAAGGDAAARQAQLGAGARRMSS
jgi:glycerol-3-phosphate O-acyltransferase